MIHVRVGNDCGFSTIKSTSYFACKGHGLFTLEKKFSCVPSLMCKFQNSNPFKVESQKTVKVTK